MEDNADKPLYILRSLQVSIVSSHYIPSFAIDCASAYSGFWSIFLISCGRVSDAGAAYTSPAASFKFKADGQPWDMSKLPFNGRGR